MPSLVSSILITMLNKKTACRALGTLASLVLSSVPSSAMVGGALAADQTIARHVVLIIGGFSSISGAIVGGLLVGASESLADIYLGPLLAGGAVSNWFAYVLAVGFLLVRPSGLFGDPAIERV